MGLTALEKQSHGLKYLGRNLSVLEDLHLLRPDHQHVKTTECSRLLSRLEYALPYLPSLPLMQVAAMISHCPLATLLSLPISNQLNHCPNLDSTLLLEGEGSVTLQRYQPRSPESSPHHWVSTAPVVNRNPNDCLFKSCFHFLESTGPSCLVKQSERCYLLHIYVLFLLGMCEVLQIIMYCSVVLLFF